jgi:hypothetical protein
LVANATELPASAAGTLAIVLDPRPNATPKGESPEQTSKYIQGELLSLSLRHADIQQRIQQVRHALVALVQVFGPEILASAAKRRQSDSQNLSRTSTKVIDISRRVLSRSLYWLTFEQILEAVEKEFPSTFAGFINPGVSVSNALRTLERHGEVESSSGPRPASWRWRGNSRAAENEGSQKTNFD